MQDECGPALTKHLSNVNPVDLSVNLELTVQAEWWADVLVSLPSHLTGNLSRPSHRRSPNISPSRLVPPPGASVEDAL